MRDALSFEPLEDRAVPAAASVSQATAGGPPPGTLTVTADAAGDDIDIFLDGDSVVVRSRGVADQRFLAAGVQRIAVNGGAGDDVVKVSDELTLAATLSGGGGRNKLRAGGGNAAFAASPPLAAAAVLAGTPTPGTLFVGGLATNVFPLTQTGDAILKAEVADTVPAGSNALVDGVQPVPPGTLGIPQQTLTADEVGKLLARASAATTTNDAIIAIVDRNGRILGVRVEAGVDPAIRNNNELLTFAIDGAVAKARTGAFFGNNQAPLTSRTIQNLSESTITDREVNSNPSITDPNSTARGPGYVAAVGVKGHFPNGIVNTPQVDLFGIEHTNRDGTFHVGNDRIKGTADDVQLAQRFNIDPNFVPAGQSLSPPDSYGFESRRYFNAQGRGIATLPGGMPLYKYNPLVGGFGVEEVGGIGVFFPGKTGFATEENSELSSTYDRTKPDRTIEAEFIALAAMGGITGGASLNQLLKEADPDIFTTLNTVNALVPIQSVNAAGQREGVAPLPVNDENQRIDLVGLNLDIIGRGGVDRGVRSVLGVGRALRPTDFLANVSGANVNVTAGADNILGNGDDVFLRAGRAVPEGYLVTPHDGVGITAAEVQDIITNGLAQAYKTRAAIRLPLGSFSGMVFAVADQQGNVVGLYRMPDATIFSIDVAVAKARNVAYYADPAQLQPQDQLAGVPAGTAFTNRTFRYTALPRFPESIDLNSVPGPHSQLNDGQFDKVTGIGTNGPLPASAFQSVLGYDSFNPGTNFRQQGNVLNQNGIVFFPGSAPLYRGTTLIGGFGVSGDGVDQDDVVTGAGQKNFQVPSSILKADQVFFNGIRLPYQKHNRNPEG